MKKALISTLFVISITQFLFTQNGDISGSPDVPDVSRSLLAAPDVIVHKGEAVTLEEPAAQPKPFLYRHRNRILPVLIGGLVFAEACGYYDAHETVIGLRHGVAVEGNTFLIGAHPSFGPQVARDQINVFAALFLPSLGWIKRWPMLLGATSDAPYIEGMIHIKAGNSWRKLLSQQ